MIVKQVNLEIYIEKLLSRRHCEMVEKQALESDLYQSPGFDHLTGCVAVSTIGYFKFVFSSAGDIPCL